MPFSIDQLGAKHQAKEILEAAGLLGDSDISETSWFKDMINMLDMHLGSASHPSLIFKAGPSTAVPFTLQQILSGANRVTQQSYVQAIIEHPVNSVVEYPQTGMKMGKGITHHFLMNPKVSRFINPKDNIQYSLGDVHGQHARVTCHLLRDLETQESVDCLQVKLSCRCIKYCSFNIPTLSVSPKAYCNDSSGHEVFLKTLAFYCVIIEHGCPFSAQSHSERGEECAHHYDLPSQIPQTLNEESEAESDSDSDDYEVLLDI
ncbi:hypothetical protein K439DRAFT_1619588 [Ramaria rubella]|nr:hypothetical protein K439DRAFT_1619588 [Ramaria rubella]